MNQPQVQNQGTTEPVLFVSLQGDDGWSGHRAEPNMAKTDGPLLTFEAAQSAVRRLKSTLKVPVTIKVMIRGGVYELNQTLVFSALDSGFSRATERLAQTWPVIWMAYPGETPVLSGGSRITTPWRIETVHGRAAWVTELTEVARDRWYFKQLWVNGQ